MSEPTTPPTPAAGWPPEACRPPTWRRFEIKLPSGRRVTSTSRLDAFLAWHTIARDRISLLDRGFVYAIAHIRGGSDLGRPWYDAGKILHKKNTFLDFIAAAEHLQKAGYSAPDRTAILGGSAGGLLMGAVMNMRPELFHAVVAHVPFVDVLNTAERQLHDL